MWILVVIFLLFGVAYVVLNKKQEQKVKEQFSEKPDLNKRHSIQEGVVLAKSIDQVWTYLSNPELYKQWHSGLKSITPFTGELFSQNSKMNFYFNDGPDGALQVEIVNRKDKEYVAFCSQHLLFGFERYEWLLLEAMPSGETKLTVVCDHRYTRMVRMSFIRVWRLNSLTNAYLKILQGDLAELQRMLA